MISLYLVQMKMGQLISLASDRRALNEWLVLKAGSVQKVNRKQFSYG